MMIMQDSGVEECRIQIIIELKDAGFRVRLW